MDTIDWGTAQRVGELIAGSPPFGGVRSASVEPLVREFAGKVAAYSGLSSTSELPSLELVDRPGWIAANLRTMRPLLAPLADTVGNGAGPLAGPLRSASGLLLGAQVGALTGMLSQRVLGQYDLALLDASVKPRLLLLAPNLAQAARTLGVDRDELVLWVSIHEITHAVQFSGAPWLRDYLGGMLKELIDGLQVTIAGHAANGDGGDDDRDEPADTGNGKRDGWLGSMPRLPDVSGWVPDLSQLREIVERARRGEVMRLTLGEDRWQLVERMQAAMSLIEGHAEHTMDAIGAEVLPTLPRLRKAMNHRRENRGLPWRVLERLLGLELKLRQYETGRRFCDAVVDAGGPQALTLAWSGPEALPTPAELEDPSLWIARVTGPSGGAELDSPGKHASAA
ncbi:MAG TPA: zinc-dependent metalloprotease [Solirubrobacteraceae bacterium]|nr:zinc-dependent metalloprotease [Solirubrobacteraceae bacterium]